MRRDLRALLPSLVLAVAVAAAAVLSRAADPPPQVAARQPPGRPTAEPATAIGQPAALRLVALPPPPTDRAVTPTADPTSATVTPGGAARAARRMERPTAGGRQPPDGDPDNPVLRPSAGDLGPGLLLLERIPDGAERPVEIAWPEDRAARETLRRHLRRCAGWQALLLADGQLWRAADPPGIPWEPPAGMVSGLLRRLDGPAADAAAVAAIRARHGLAGGRPVATVARRWDARLLGGLARLLGPGAAASALQARYAVDGGRLTVTSIRTAGRPVPGTVDLGPVSACRG